MPAKHSIKQYFPNSYYHLFNRGVEKRKIFQDEQDYIVFLSYLKTYLSPKNIVALQQQLTNPKINWSQKRKILAEISLKNFCGEIQLVAYCLMPNHFHFLIKQKSAAGIDCFMQSLATRYAMFFNQKNKRVGPLFQGKYKAVLISTDEQLLHLSRYIHLQSKGSDPIHSYSSYIDYLGKRNTTWVKKDLILSYFSKTNPKFSYQNFVEKQGSDFSSFGRLIIE